MLEIGFTTLLIAMTIAIVWFASFVVYRLYQGQR